MQRRGAERAARHPCGHPVVGRHGLGARHRAVLLNPVGHHHARAHQRLRRARAAARAEQPRAECVGPPIRTLMCLFLFGTDWKRVVQFCTTCSRRTTTCRTSPTRFSSVRLSLSSPPKFCSLRSSHPPLPSAAGGHLFLHLLAGDVRVPQCVVIRKPRELIHESLFTREPSPIPG